MFCPSCPWVELTSARQTSGGANFRLANLSGTNLSGANLSGTDLREVGRPGIFPLFIESFSSEDLNKTKSLTLAQVKAACNWEQAIYSDDFRQKLGLPLPTQKAAEPLPEGNDPEATSLLSSESQAERSDCEEVQRKFPQD